MLALSLFLLHNEELSCFQSRLKNPSIPSCAWGDKEMIEQVRPPSLSPTPPIATLLHTAGVCMNLVSKQMGKQWKQWETLLSWAPKSLQIVTTAMKLKDTSSLEEKLWRPSSVQSLSRVRLFATPWMAALQASLSITNSRSSPRLTSIESVMPSSHLILCCPLFPPAPNPSQHQSLFQWVNSSHEVAKVLVFQL